MRPDPRKINVTSAGFLNNRKNLRLKIFTPYCKSKCTHLSFVSYVHKYTIKKAIVYYDPSPRRTNMTDNERISAPNRDTMLATHMHKHLVGSRREEGTRQGRRSNAWGWERKREEREGGRA
jgi:hypothetical protein